MNPPERQRAFSKENGMETTNTAPVTITTEAAARIYRYGLRPSVDRMLEYMQQNFYGLHAIELDYDEGAEVRGEAELHFTVYRKFPPGVERDRTDWEWSGWMARNIPPEVGIHFTSLTIYEENHAR
jgi:hypothetical protein